MNRASAIGAVVASGLVTAAGAQGLCGPMEDGLTLLIADEDFLDNGTSSVEFAAYDCGVTPDMLVNDEDPVEYGNPPLYWNAFCPGGEYWLPTGQIGDEGLFAPGMGTGLDLGMFVTGMIDQAYLDEIPDVRPLRDGPIAGLVGQSVVAVVYDSDVSINTGGSCYAPAFEANLQGDRYGLFFFTVFDVREAGFLPESRSSDILFEVLVRVDPVPMDYCWTFYVDPDPDVADLNGDYLHDLCDVNLFVMAFLHRESPADIAEPYGVWDLADITAFIDAFVMGWD